MNLAGGAWRLAVIGLVLMTLSDADEKAAIDWQIVPSSLSMKRIGVVSRASASDKTRNATSANSRQPSRPSNGASISGMRAPPTGNNFDRERLAALFGSDAQPVYGTRDPTTGRVTFDTVTDSSAPVKTRTVTQSDTLTNENEEQVDRKDTRVPETNEINPFELLPPQFHDLLNIPIHDYGNGTTFNPYDKYKVPKVPKIPVVSSGYANTKVQGSSGPSQTQSGQAPQSKPINEPDDYDYDFDYGKKNTKATNKPMRTSTHGVKTTTAPPIYDDYDDFYASTTKKRPTTTKPYRKHPSKVEPYRGPDSQEPPKDPVKPKPDYEEPVKYKPVYEEPPRYKPEYEEPPRYKPEYDEPPKYKPNYEEPPRYKPEYEEPPRYKPEYDEPPRYKPSYEEPPRYKPEYDEPPRYKPSYEEPPRYKPDYDEPPRYKPSYEDPPKYQAEKAEPPRYGGEHQEPPRYQAELQEPPKYKAARPPSELSKNKEAPIYIAQSYKPPFESTEIKVTPKPFYAVDNQDFGSQGVAGQVDDAPDIIYDYDDERGKGDGVLFMFDRPQNNQGVQYPTNNQPLPPYQSPKAKPLPARIQPEHVGTPAFRPSIPMDKMPPDGFTPKPDFSKKPTSQPVQINGQVVRQAQPNPWAQSPFGSEVPRPPFSHGPQVRPAVEAKQQDAPQEKQPMVVLPLFRPNAKPSEEFKFINQQPAANPTELQRQPNPDQETVQRPQVSGQNRPIQRPLGPRPPLPSALRSPLAQVSQAVANFFGRRSGLAGNNQQKRSTGSASADFQEQMKNDRLGEADDMFETDQDDMETSESRFQLFTGQQPPPQVERAEPIVTSHPSGTSHLMAIQTPAAANSRPGTVSGTPPAFYMYTSKDLEEGRPPFLVVGPQQGPPPKVQGAELVHTIPVQSIPPDGQRRNDQVPGALRPASPNALPLNPNAPAVSESTPVLIRKPVPVRTNRPVGLAPPPAVSATVNPQHSPNRPAFLFPERPDKTSLNPQEIPVGISPTVQGVVSPPRVPLNPQKDVATPFSDHVLLHSRPEAEPVWTSVPSVQSVPVEVPVPPVQPTQPNQPPADVKPARKPSKPGLVLNSALPLMTAQSKPFSIAPTPSADADEPVKSSNPATAPVQTVPNPIAPAADPLPINVATTETSTATPTSTTTAKPATTTAKSQTTTPEFTYQSFNQLAPVKYSTIQQEDGKQIAVVHPAYIVTYKYKPDAPELVDLDAPFMASAAGPASDESRDSPVAPAHDQWQAVYANDRSDDTQQDDFDQTESQSQSRSQYVEPQHSSSHSSFSSLSVGQPNYETGFLPYVPDRD